MGDFAHRRRLFHLFADLLDYPRSGLVESARECPALVSPGNPEAAALLHEFRAFVEGNSLGQVQEVYTRTFDLNAAFHPYVGHHLFGESYKRSAFMLGLKERYQAYGFAVEGELPDHLAVLLRFLSRCEDASLAAEIVHEAMLPALERMAKKVADGEAQAEGDRRRRVYQQVLKALRLVLQELPLSSQQPARMLSP